MKNKGTNQGKQKQKKLNHHKHLMKQKNIKETEERTTIFRNLVKTITKLSTLIHIFIATFAVGLGFVFNAFDEMSLFRIKALIGFILYLVLSYTIMKIEEKNDRLIMELTGDPQLVKCQVNYTKKIYSNFNFILCFIACIYFVTISIILGFVKINLIGIYSLFCLSCVVFVAFIIFQQYMYILFLLYNISKISPGRFYELIPERTEWFDLLENFSNICRNLFIILGSLFVLLFILFSPVNSVQIIFQEKFLSYKFIPLLCTWIIIFVAIVFMIPFSSFVRNNLLQRIYRNLVTQSIENYNRLYEKENKSNNKLLYMDIILHLNDRKYILQNSYAWIIPVLVSVTNFTSIFISIIVDLKELHILT